MKATYKIIIWGAGNTAVGALKLLSDEVEIIGYCDNDRKHELVGYCFLEWNKIKEMEFDYIVICSVFYEEIYKQLVEVIKIPKSKILIYNFDKSECYRIYYSNFFEKKWKKMIDMADCPEVFISGISYHNDGIDDETILNIKGKTAFNFALRGQDIYFDWKIAQLLEKEGYLKNVQYYIIGLSYYCFEYDMSKSANAWEVIRYYPYIKELHNLMHSNFCEKYVEDMKQKIEDEKIYYQLFPKREINVINRDIAQKCANRDFNKNYPITVWENKKILRSFIVSLKDKGIKPIIVIMPAVREYVECCPGGIVQNFYNNLEGCVENYDIQILDYFGKYYGREDDWYHVTHFNKGGAKRFTEKLIEDIKW